MQQNQSRILIIQARIYDKLHTNQAPGDREYRRKNKVILCEATPIL